MPHIQLLQVSADEEDTSELRILVAGKDVKYLTIDHGVYSIQDMCFGPAITTMLPPLPLGDWNEGHISYNPQKGQPEFSHVAMTKLPGITTVWHSQYFDHLELQLGEKLRSNVYKATCPRLKGTVILKMARFSWEIPQFEDETEAYQWLEGHNIGPAFLGHVTEAGRVIGFVMECIQDFRHAEPKDLLVCQQALSRLHQSGFIHGDVNKHNFLISYSGAKATLIDFDMTRECEDKTVLEEEFSSLERELADTSGRGGVVVTYDGSDNE